MTEQFFWISKYGDAIYIGYGMEKIEELKIDFSNNKELEPLIIIQYVSEDCINSMVLLKDLNNIFYIFEELDYPEINSIKKSFHESDFEKFKEIIFISSGFFNDTVRCSSQFWLQNKQSGFSR